METGVQWSAVLTGAPDSQTDLTLQVKNMRVTLRDSTSTFISCTVNYEQLDDVLLRPNGEIVIYKTKLPDGSPVEVKRCNFSEFRNDRGAVSQSLTIGGRTTVGFGTGVTVNVVGVSDDRTLADGSRQLTINPMNDVKPGDTVTFDAVSTLIDSVDIQARHNFQQMIVGE